MTARFDLLVIGDANPDIVLHGAPRELAYGQAEQLVDSGALTMGGSAAITACGGARLGLRTALVSVVGDDAAGRFVLDELERRGVDTGGVVRSAGWTTGLTIALSRREDRAIVTSPGCIDELHAGLVDAGLLSSARHVHVGSFFLQPHLAAGLAALFAAAHAAGATTSLDLNWDPTERWDGGLAAVLPAVDVLFVNAVEAAAVSGAADPGSRSDGARRPRPAAGDQARRRRRAGARRRAGWSSVSAPETDVADTVGAGDSFDAGFICARLLGWEVSRALALGAAVGLFDPRRRRRGRAAHARRGAGADRRARPRRRAFRRAAGRFSPPDAGCGR